MTGLLAARAKVGEDGLVTRSVVTRAGASEAIGSLGAGEVVKCRMTTSSATSLSSLGRRTRRGLLVEEDLFVEEDLLTDELCRVLSGVTDTGIILGVV